MGSRGPQQLTPEARKRSIRLRFHLPGAGRMSESLPMLPTPVNMRYAQRLLDEIARKISDQSFVYSDYFPDSPRCILVGAATIRGFVYVLEQERTGEIKVGYTTDERRLKGRLAALGSGSPYPLHVVRTFRGVRADEKAIHKALREHRLEGEWFSGVPYVRGFVEGLGNG